MSARAWVALAAVSRPWGSPVVLGIFCTAEPFVLRRARRRGGPGTRDRHHYVAMALGVAVLGERPGAGAAAGLLLIVARDGRPDAAQLAYAGGSTARGPAGRACGCPGRRHRGRTSASRQRVLSVECAGERKERRADAAVFRDALRTHDLAELAAVPGADVGWYDCRTRAEVLATLRDQFDAAAPQHDLR